MTLVSTHRRIYCVTGVGWGWGDRISMNVMSDNQSTKGGGISKMKLVGENNNF